MDALRQDIRYALRLLGRPPAFTAADDVVAARKAGVHAVAVAWGYGDGAELAAAAPDATVRSAEELVACIRFRAS